MRILAWDGQSRYLVSTRPELSPTAPVQIVNVDRKTVSRPLIFGSVVAMGDPDEWQERPPGLDEEPIMELVKAASAPRP